MTKLTKWINVGDQQPVHPGWYDIRWSGDTRANLRRFFWTGEKWRDADMAWTLFGNLPKTWGKDAWRGLAQDPALSSTAKEGE